MVSEQDILQSIKPKSDQLNADDLLAGPIVVTVVDVLKGDQEQPVALVIDGDRQPFKPCKSMRRLLVAVWGSAPKNWKGKKLRLYCDPEVKWGGVKVGGIRISAMSGIENPTSVLLTTTRGKRSEHTVQPLETADHDNLIAAFAQFKVSQADIEKHLGHPVEELTEPEREALGSIWHRISKKQTTWAEATA